MSGYWDIPDGTNCVRKIWLAGRFGAITGLIGSVYHIVLYSPDTTLEGLRRTASSTVTMATLGAVFAATSCISADLREAPEDPMNYFIGGCASGAVLGARSNSFLIGSSACVGLGALGAFVKVARKQGWKFLEPPQQ
ncbi:NADH dehydrogenase [ubiquinone] 1 alpha subcomplex subunit 11 isoform X2 [Python bivittatus]|uniref:NADH dehydrogenase [ubiquinone] 1 alpha subcomplex subunit 11 n=1 Tax=Python bivittatus TaxID=176946 RepID=A0A9F2QZW0_PYTBI|nr:NADH dehydrogenase [ubiquinone] 1 alpha subcomplex subunit 11 isoform X1 [Python bivittatus]XP_025024644.1 NADH dehydrogenase [ubiquinone] 1 alpha subcomplex subunit 11 isoform X2 [Python bivittatus]